MTSQGHPRASLRNLPPVVVPWPWPRPKTLTERVLKGSFRPRHHDHLLEQDALDAACPSRGMSLGRIFYSIFY